MHKFFHVTLVCVIAALLGCKGPGQDGGGWVIPDVAPIPTPEFQGGGGATALETVGAAGQSRTIIKSYYEKGDRPNEQNFVDWIDSSGWQSETNTWTAVNTATGTWNFATATATDLTVTNTLTAPTGAAPTTSVGQLAMDNDAWAASRGAFQTGDGTANTYLVGVLESDTPTNGEVLKWNTGGTITWETDSGGAFVDADPIVPNSPGNDTHFGGGAGTLTGKVEIKSDSDQPTLVLEGGSPQTDDVFIIQNDADTEVFSVGNDGTVQTRSVDAASMADADHGDVNWSTGVATVQGVDPDSVALTTDTTGNYAAGDAEAGAALTGDSATAFFAAGTIEHERGGLEADVSGYTDGLYGMAAGVTADIDTEAELETALGGLDVVTVTTDDITSANLATLVSDETGSGNVVFSSAPVFTGAVTLPAETVGTTAADGDDDTSMATTAFVQNARHLAYAIADLGDPTTPSVLTAEETTNKLISNYQSSGADHVFTMPAAHTGGNVAFVVGDEFQVDLEPDSGDIFYLNGTAMAADEHIQNTADTLGDTIVGVSVNINGTLRWLFRSSDANWVEATP